MFTTTAAHAHSAHVDATDLAPGTEYRYRFRYADWTSPVGRTRTLPDGSPDRFGIGVVNCQMYEAGHYAAYRHLLDEDIDLVLHLGDYVYEYPFNILPDRPVLPDRYLETVEDFRLRYAVYKADADLQAAHQRFPFVVTWDDHEVANNYMGDLLSATVDADRAKGKARKAAAYQAWWEHLPTRTPAPDSSELTIYQAVTAGDLFRLHVLDQRQYSDLPPCRDSSQAATDYGDCDARTAEDRTRLGDEQEGWLERSLAEGGVTWNLLGNPVVLAGVDGGTDESAYYLDTWDGFPQARTRLIEQLAEVDNPVVLTGDYHAGMVLDVGPDARSTPATRPGGQRVHGAPRIVTAVLRRRVGPHAPAPRADQRPRLPDRRGHPEAGGGGLPLPRRRDRRDADTRSTPGRRGRWPPAIPEARSA